MRTTIAIFIALILTLGYTVADKAYNIMDRAINQRQGLVAALNN